jgi:hypothetical protein
MAGKSVSTRAIGFSDLRANLALIQTHESGHVDATQAKNHGGSLYDSVSAHGRTCPDAVNDFGISGGVYHCTWPNGAQSFGRPDDQRVHPAALGVSCDKIGVIENLNALIPEITIRDFFPYEAVVGD